MSLPAGSCSFPISTEFIKAISLLRLEGPGSVIQFLSSVNPTVINQCPFLREIEIRCLGRHGPRLLVDGVWLSRTYGGISRVWRQILRTWSLPGLVSDSSPIFFIDRNSCVAETDFLPQIPASSANPYDWPSLGGISIENGEICQQVSADVFLSTWITTCGTSAPNCSELALVHDCIPERMSALDKGLRSLRRRWLLGASSHLAVSHATALDISSALGLNSVDVDWCHPSTIDFFQPLEGLLSSSDLVPELDLPFPFVLLPATAGIGSYKNPELLLSALADSRLSGLNLLLTGQSCDDYIHAFEEFQPSLIGRIYSRCLTDLQLQIVYKKALCVVVPSRFEGFGLPVIEALASGSFVIATDVPGLREASSGCVPCVDPDSPSALADWLSLLLDLDSSSWIRPHLQRRCESRLARLHPDLLGFSLLIKARQLFEAVSG